jgi:signal transduction histidine kinase
MLRRARPYLAVLVAVLGATLLRMALTPVVGLAIPFLTYFLAALLLTWHFGFASAAFSIAISTIVGGHYILAVGTDDFLPATRADRVAMFGFVLASLSVSFLLDVQRRTLQRARSAETEQMRVNAELARVNQDLEAFVYSAGHDLREPMRTIALSAEFLEGRLRTTLKDDDARFLSYIQTSARRMNALLDALLEYAKAGKRKQGPTGVIDVDRLMGDLLATLGASISAAGATVSCTRLPHVAMEENHIVQVLQNLVSNALKYGGKQISISGDHQGGSCVFSVTDDGAGIASEHAEQIFGLFNRLNRKSDSEGSGVGLAICRRVVELYGGQVWLSKSQPGEGSTFCFSIPIEDAQNRMREKSTLDDV